MEELKKINKKILLVEDNKEISDSIFEYLELEGFSVDRAFNGEDGLDKLMQNCYDLVLLDLMLPKIDGLTIAKKITQKKDIAIIMLTAKNSIDDKLEGFNSGAVDYIVKPFDLRELEARVNAILKLNISKLIEFNNIKIDLDKREFFKDGIKVKTTTKEYLIIKYLYENKNRVCTRGDLVEYIWGADDLFNDDSKLDVYVSTIRKKLTKNIIETVKSVGYKFGNL